jgi:hypothetical protein
MRGIAMRLSVMLLQTGYVNKKFRLFIYLSVQGFFLSNRRSDPEDFWQNDGWRQMGSNKHKIVEMFPQNMSNNAQSYAASGY